MRSGQRLVHKNNTFLWIGGIFLLVSAVLVGLIFFSAAKEEVSYQYRHLIDSDSISAEITPVDTDFGIVISKLGANSKVIANVDPYNSFAYQRALTQGVAHAQGTKLPGEKGNVFLFAHSSSSWYIANQYNSVFYLLYKLEVEDKIDIYYLGQKYTYTVSDKKIVNPNEINYLTSTSSEPILTLMTCWPAGTTYKRLLIIAKIVNQP